MIKTSRMSTSPIRQNTQQPDPANRVIFQMIQASANDNVMPAMKWFTWLIAWTIVVGTILAYAVF